MERLDLEDFDWSYSPTTLREVLKPKIQKFNSIFIKSIAKDVIKILSPKRQDPSSQMWDQANDELVHNQLTEPLEKFICNLEESATTEDVQQNLERIRALNQPSKICRRILKTGDINFSCNDCGFDGSCVVCIDCFHKGAHKDHNYRMSSSDGGGCCDCGDIEAWKQNYACSDHSGAHQLNLKLSDFEDIELRSKQIREDKKITIEKINCIPKDVASRYYLVCQVCLHYAREMLSWNDFSNLPPQYEFDASEDADLLHLLSKDANSKNFYTVIFNDEVHTYDYVINTLVKIIKCSKMTASIMASTVSREGRSLIIKDNSQSCSRVKDMIASVRDAGQGPLKVELIHGTVLAHQAFAIKLIEWIRKMSSICDAFRIITAYTLLGGYDPMIERGEAPDSMTVIERIMLSNTNYWKMARVEWNDLFVTTMLTEYSIKEEFARRLTRIYPKLVQEFIKDDHDHSVSILTMTTQLYTVPSLVCMLIEEENALAIISKTLIDTCKSRKRENPAISYENRNTFDMQGLKRGLYTIQDIKCLINIQPTKWTVELRKNVIEAVRIFLDLLSSMQGMDSVRRQLGQHLEYEPDWESGMTLQSRLITVITRLVEYCSFDEEVLVAALKETQTRLLKNGTYKMISKELFGHKTSCIQYDVSTSPVSVHLPLTRFAAALIVELMKRRLVEKGIFDESLVILTEQGESRSKQTMIDIMEPSLRTEVMIAQFRSGMWRRNGYSLVNQIMFFHGAPMRREMFDRDILVLQECAAMCNPDKFIIHLLNKFQLFTWVRSETTREPLSGAKAVSLHNDEDIMAQTMSLGEEFLQLLLTIVGERYRLGIGLIEEADVIKNEIIQILCIGPTTRSELSQKLHVSDSELDCIKLVANLRRSSEASTGKYELKEEFYGRFNPFFYHYSRRNQSNALDAQLKRKKNLKENLICCPPPAPVELTKQFSNLNELLKCDITLRLIKKILTRALGPGGPSKDVLECSTKALIRFVASDLQLDQCLHLIGLGLYEQERDPENFNYLQAAYDNDIFLLLKDCYEIAKRSKDLVFWLMKKTNELMNLRESFPVDTETSKTISSIRECFGPTLHTCDSMKQDNKKRNSELATQRRERIMAMMKMKQDKFLSNPTTKQLVADTDKSESPKNTPNISSQAASTSQSNVPIYTTRSGRKTKPPKSISGPTFDSNASHKEQAIPNALHQSTDSSMVVESEDERMDSESIRFVDEETSHLCIFCRDEQKIGFDQSTMVLLAYVQRSSVLSKNRAERRVPNYALTPSNQLKNLFLSQHRTKQGNSPDNYSFTSDNSWNFDATFMPNDLFFGPHISTCGHAMHYECWQGFFDTILKRETSRPNRNSRHVSFELEKHEILCPLCECICNATIPLIPHYTKFSPQGSTIFSASPEIIEKSPENLSACLNVLRCTVDNKLENIRHTSGSHNDKHMRLLQPKGLNEVLEDLTETEALSLRDFIKSIMSDKITSSSCTKSLLSSLSTLAERIHSVGLDLDRSITDIQHSRIFMMTSWSISYTVQTFERVSRYKGTPLLEDLESSKNTSLSFLLRFACSSMLTHQSDMMQSLLVRKLRYLLIYDEHLSSSPCCLDIDAFEMFVSLTILLQRLYAHIEETNREWPVEWSPWTTKVYDHEYYRNMLHLTLILNLSQVIVSLQNELDDIQSSVLEEDSTSSSTQQGEQESLNSSAQQQQDQECSSTKECMVLYNFYKNVIFASGHPNSRIPIVDQSFLDKVKNRLLPYLRSCAIFFFHLSHVQPPKVLQTKSAFSPGKNDLNTSDDHMQVDESERANNDLSASNEEYNALCGYLDLPSDFSVLLRSQEARDLARTWLRHSRVLVLIKSALEKRKAGLKAKVTMTAAQVGGKPLKRVGSSSGSIQSTMASAPLSSSLPNTTLSCSPQQQISKTDLMPVKFIRQPHLVNRLIELPYDYSELVDKVSDFTCPSIKNEDSRTPTMCLICGVMLCSQSYCCQRDLNDLASNYQDVLQRQHGGNFLINEAQSSQSQYLSQLSGRSETFFDNFGVYMPNIVAPLMMGSLITPASGSTENRNSLIHQQLVGSCTYHAYECSGGVGVFLRIRSSQILLLSGRSKGCYTPAPYIDDHGETDFGLMRGNPLHLNKQHYDDLQQMWLAHAIPEKISRTLEYSPYASSINWHLH